jgi:hypothetical protein
MKCDSRVAFLLNANCDVELDGLASWHEGQDSRRKKTKEEEKSRKGRFGCMAPVALCSGGKKMISSSLI